MARIKIFKKDGTPTPYFWSDRQSDDRTRATVFKETQDGVKRIKTVVYNAVTNRLQKQA
ncbi:MAG TPA: hypothetical protein VK939_01285 [Longimicrobiales bacterium]|nr:hypothetical protein [Longimicrobiales bacterium]